MSVRDKIRDELYGEDQDDVEDEVASAAYSDILESASDPSSAFLVLAVTLAAEVGLAAMSLIARDTFDALLNGGNILYAALAVFAIGFLIVFTICRLFEQSFNWGQSASTSPDILSGSTGRKSASSLGVWFISSGAGVANVILFYVLLRLI